VAEPPESVNLPGSRAGRDCEQVRENFAGNVALGAARDLGLGLAFGGAAGEVVLGRLVAAHADQGHTSQGAVGPAVAVVVQPVPTGPARGDWDLGDTKFVYETAVRHTAELKNANGYQRVDVVNKESTGSAWMQLIDLDRPNLCLSGSLRARGSHPRLPTELAGRRWCS